jgi:molybdopterin converting factor small subunit
MSEGDKPCVYLKFPAGGHEISKLVKGTYYASTLGELYEQILDRLRNSGREDAHKLYDETWPILYLDETHTKRSQIQMIIVNDHSYDREGKIWSLESILSEGDSIHILAPISGG